MASEAMENAIMMDVMVIQTILDDSDYSQIAPDFHESIQIRLDSIKRTLNKGDPHDNRD